MLDLPIKDRESKEAKDTAVKIAVAKGDGIGPEIMNATLRILEKAGANIEPEFVDIGEQVYLSGNTSGIDPEAWKIIRKNKVFLKSPITTPQGKGYKSLNVTLRKSLGLFANVRPVISLHPYVDTNFENMNVVIVRENEEDLYAGIEHRQTEEVVQCLKLVSRPGCEKIVRYAFEYAKANGRKKITCMLKDNIMKMSDGIFHEVFNEIGQEYPEIKQEVQIIDIATARLAARPEDYDVIVTTNLYGDIVSDVAAEIAGSVGMAGSANIGTQAAMFEAIHGSAPDIAGLAIANPSGLLNAAIMMLEHIGQQEIGAKIKNAWLAAIEDGLHTRDIYAQGRSTKKMTTSQFADAVIERLGSAPQQLHKFEVVEGRHKINIPEYSRKTSQKTLVGADIFLDWAQTDANKLGQELEAISS
ncbi:MAG: NADP-dependent isocitrate dehydrogenase, partial [Bacteroidota bacterium]